MPSWVPELLETVHGRTPYRRHELRTALERFALWAEGPAALDGEASDLLTVRNIERFAQTGIDDYAPASRGNIRSRLLRISELVLDPQGRRVRLLPMPPADPLSPYAPHEVAALRSWATTQSTERRRMNAIALLALGLGAGLSSAEIGEARADDARQVDDTIDIRVQGARARTVPMIARWAHELAPVLEHRRPGAYIFRPDRSGVSPNFISNFVGRGSAADVRPQSQRMRTTWVVEHLNNDTNIRLLVRMAGVESLSSFTRYLEFVSEPDSTTARQQLVNPTRRPLVARRSA